MPGTALTTRKSSPSENCPSFPFCTPPWLRQMTTSTFSRETSRRAVERLLIERRTFSELLDEFTGVVIGAWWRRRRRRWWRNVCRRRRRIYRRAGVGAPPNVNVSAPRVCANVGPAHRGRHDRHDGHRSRNQRHHRPSSRGPRPHHMAHLRLLIAFRPRINTGCRRPSLYASGGPSAGHSNGHAAGVAAAVWIPVTKLTPHVRCERSVRASARPALYANRLRGLTRILLLRVGIS